MVNFFGKPKTKAEKGEEILKQKMTANVIESLTSDLENEDNLKDLELISSTFPVKKIGDFLRAGEFFIWNGTAYKVLREHEITAHHNPDTQGTHLYINLIPKNEETGYREITDDLIPFEITYGERIIYKDKIYKLIRQNINRIDSPDWMPPNLMNDFWKLIEE